VKLRPPPDEERTRAWQAIVVLSLGLIAIGTYEFVDEWIHNWHDAAYTLGVENLFLIAAFWLNLRGQMEWAVRIICVSELASVLLLTFVFGVGLTDSDVLLFPMILVTAAVLLDWRSYVGFARFLVISIAATGFTIAARGGPTKYHNVLHVVNTLVVTGLAVGLLARNLKRSVSKAREAEQEIRALSARLIDAQEEERSRIARDLHDDLSQQIAALSIGMGNLKRKIPPEQAEARGQSDQLQQKLVAVSEAIRRISHELHPGLIEHYGLASALRAYCSEFGALTGIQVSFQEAGVFEGVPPSIALCVYRIAQEALQNVARHACVKEAKVELSRVNGWLCLAVSDRGIGIQPGRTGLGLVSIRERTRLAKGECEILSKPDEGTTVRVTIPA
jgi:signal transduction histidine kinase